MEPSRLENLLRIPSAKLAIINASFSGVNFCLFLGVGRKLGLEALGTLSLYYSLFALLSGILSLGQCERLQSLFANDDKDSIKYNLPFRALLLSACLASIAIILVRMYLPELSPLLLTGSLLSAYAMIVHEMYCRSLFQHSEFVKGQVLSSLPPVLLWSVVLLTAKSNNIDGLLSTIVITYLLFGTYSLYRLSKVLSFSFRGVGDESGLISQKAILGRTILQALEPIPLFLLTFGSSGYLSGVYSIVSKIYAPINIALSSHIGYMQVQAFSSNAPAKGSALLGVSIRVWLGIVIFVAALSSILISNFTSLGMSLAALMFYSFCFAGVKSLMLQLKGAIEIGLKHTPASRYRILFLLIALCVSIIYFLRLHLSQPLTGILLFCIPILGLLALLTPESSSGTTDSTQVFETTN